MEVVVGSGPAGVACAKTLLARGKIVRMLDAGVALEASREALVAEMSQTTPAEWTPRQLSRIKEGTSATAKGIPLKLVYGSDFPYREAERHVPADYDGVGLRPSLARGGFSNVWGAALMPYAQRDLSGWPIQVSDLSDHYVAALKLTRLSAQHDRLEQSFPLYREPGAALGLSRQSRTLLDKLEQNQAQLAAAGISFGQARVAVQAAHPGQRGGCVYCGLCMYGCPYGYIYNSADTLRELQTQPNFSYQPGVIVTSVREMPSKVVLAGSERETGEPLQIEADRVFLAAGVMPTTQILLRSMGCYDQTVWMKDSQYFLIPLALMKSAGQVRHEPLHTLSQLFLEIFDPKISPCTVHLQIYSYNDLVGQAVGKALGPLAKRLDFLARALENRLLIIQGYLHSDHSSRIAVALKRGQGKPDRLQLTAQPNPETRPIIGRVLRKLLRHARQIGAWPVLPLLQVAEAGRGFHSGGTFPMRSQPGPLQTDALGRPRGWKRVHVVDATVLPSIPATTITLSVMANAHRIGSEAPLAN